MLTLGKPLSLWYNSFELHNLVPVQFIKHQTVSLCTTLNDHDTDNVIIVCPSVNSL